MTAAATAFKSRYDAELCMHDDKDSLECKNELSLIRKAYKEQVADLEGEKAKRMAAAEVASHAGAKRKRQSEGGASTSAEVEVEEEEEEVEVEEEEEEEKK
jgi:hypothetical protein